MLRLATDEDFNNRIVRGFCRQPDPDILRVQDAGLAGKKDDEVLAWGSTEGRILVTHDITTMKHSI
jgi:predicted nuclease of predicted toxin-antitoxin system